MMAYDRPHGSQEQPWSPHDYRDQNANQSHMWTGYSSDIEQRSGTDGPRPEHTAPIVTSNDATYSYGGANNSLVYYHGGHYPLADNRGSGTMAGAQLTSEGMHVVPQTYAGDHRMVNAYRHDSYQPTSDFVHRPGPQSSPSASPAAQVYSMPAYPYFAATAGASASPPGPAPMTEATGTHREPQADTEYSVRCPYRCGTVLTGVHALGNLTRHLKTQACAGSSRSKVKYLCPIDGCGRAYARSDGLKVHMRRRHGAPPALPRTENSIDEDDGD